MLKKAILLFLVVMLVPAIASAKCHCKKRIKALEDRVAVLETNYTDIEGRVDALEVHHPPVSTEPGNIHFRFDTMDGYEGERGMLIIDRTGGTFGSASIDITSAHDGTATSGVDYYPSIYGTIDFRPGRGGPETIIIELYEDDEVEDTEYFDIDLINPVGATLVEPSSGRINIIDND